jgi:SAM-dependent methyltransferase
VTGGSGRDRGPTRVPVLDARAAYDRSGATYDQVRREDPRILGLLRAAVGDEHPILNVGAGTGSYEQGLGVDLAVEPAPAMIARRPPGAAPCVRALGEALPLTDRAVAAATALLTLHHFRDWRAGVRELRRVARRRVVLFTWDPAFRDALWFTAYLPAGLLDWDVARFRALHEIAAEGGAAEIVPVPIPWDCTDGFMGAYWRRPEAYLDPAVRAGISTFVQAPPDALRDGLQRLAADLASGAWAARHGALLERQELDLGYRIVVLSPRA